MEITDFTELKENEPVEVILGPIDGMRLFGRVKLSTKANIAPAHPHFWLNLARPKDTYPGEYMFGEGVDVWQNFGWRVNLLSEESYAALLELRGFVENTDPNAAADDDEED